MSRAGNTAFALLMGLEEDLVSALVAGVGDGPSPLTTSEMQTAAERVARDRGPLADVPQWSELLNYLDLGQKLGLINRVSDTVAKSFGFGRQAVRSIATDLTPLIPIRNRVCHARPLEPEDYSIVVGTASRLLSDSAFPFGELARVYQALSSSSDYPFTLQIPSFWREGRRQIDHNLPTPDFEDTGFVGREQDRQRLGQLLSGAHPVINVTGEGGLGKTSLALRCLYDLLDKPTSPFEALAWSTLKTNRLTAAGIQTIVGGLGSEIDALRPVAQMFEPASLADETRDQLYDRLIDIMQVCPLLLTIDNLEAIDSDALRPLLIRIPHPSKVLLTSRVGMGDVELRYALDPLSAADAVQLLRRAARLMNAEDLVRRDDAGLVSLCDKLYRNPLLIRWFVEGYVQGRSIPALLNTTGDFKTALNFCFQNVYERLPHQNRTVLKILCQAPGGLSEVEIALLSGIRDIDAVRGTLGYLQSSNLLHRVKDEYGQSADLTMWIVTEFARAFVNMHDRPSRMEQKRVSDDYRALLAQRESGRSASPDYGFRSHVIDARTTDEAQVRRILRSAQDAAGERDAKSALDRVEEARLLQPGFYEIYRIAAQVKAAAGDIAGAEEDYNTALALADGESQPLIVFYSQFLRGRSDVQAAIELVGSAATRSDVAPQLLTELARCYVLSGRLRDAVPVFERVGTRLMELTGAERSSYVSEHAHALRDIAIGQAGGRPDETAALLRQALEAIANACPMIAIDREIIAEGQSCFQVACRLLASTHDSDWWQSVRQSLATMGQFFPLVGSDRSGLSLLESRWKVLATSEEFVRIAWPRVGSLSGTRMNGTLLRPPPGRDFSFIRGADGVDYFVYRTALRTRVEWDDIWDKEKIPVTFAPGERVAGSGKAPKALDVVLLDVVLIDEASRSL